LTSEIILDGCEASIATRIPLTPGYYHVILAGIKGGGRYLTGLREHIGHRGYVIPSLSTRVGLKRGEYRLGTHYKNLARKLISLAGNQTIRLYAHSLGGVEVLDLAKALARQENLPHKALEVIFISPPGIGQKGMSGVREIGKRFYRVIRDFGLYDQYHLLPASFEDGALLPLKRKLFLDEWLPRLVTDKAKCERIATAIARIDAEIEFLQNHPALQKKYEPWYRRQRHKLMKPLLERVLYGSHIEEETHQQCLQRYRELVQDKVSRLVFFSLTLAFAAKALKTLYQGIDSKIISAFEYCQKLGVKTSLGVVILGKDDLVRDGDYTRLHSLTSSRRIAIHKHIFDHEEHSSVAYKWELIDALEAIQFPA
jgi:hypothetical protein